MRRGRARLATPNSKEPTTISSHKLKNLGRFRYAFDIGLGTTFLWFLLRYLGDRNPVWAIISFIVASDPSVEVARPAFLIRITHTLMGCSVGIVSILIFGATDLTLPVALTATALICTLPTKRPSSWKLAPGTAALVVASAIVDHSSLTALEEALRRTGGRPRKHYRSAHLLALCSTVEQKYLLSRPERREKSPDPLEPSQLS